MTWDADLMARLLREWPGESRAEAAVQFVFSLLGEADLVGEPDVDEIDLDDLAAAIRGDVAAIIRLRVRFGLPPLV